MSGKMTYAVSEARRAAEVLRTSDMPVQLAAAELLDAQAKHWTMWFPADPSALDRAVVKFARTVLDFHLPAATGEALIVATTEAPDADAGTRQQVPIEQKG